MCLTRVTKQIWLWVLLVTCTLWSLFSPIHANYYRLILNSPDRQSRGSIFCQLSYWVVYEHYCLILIHTTGNEAGIILIFNFHEWGNGLKPACCIRATDQEAHNSIQGQLSHFPSFIAWTVERQVLPYHKETYGGNMISKDFGNMRTSIVADVLSLFRKLRK